jgi:hypothetical protein
VVGPEDKLVKNKRIIATYCSPTDARCYRCRLCPPLLPPPKPPPMAVAAPGDGVGAAEVPPAPCGGVNVLAAAAPCGGVKVLPVAAPGGSVCVLVVAAPGGGVGVIAAAAPGSGVGESGVAPAPGGNAHCKAQAAIRNAQKNMAAAAVGGHCAPTILTNADAEKNFWGRGIRTVSSLNGLLERTQSMINLTINAGVMSRNSVDSPGTKLMNKLGMLTSHLEGLYKVRGMQVEQGVSTVAIGNAIAKLKMSFDGWCS